MSEGGARLRLICSFGGLLVPRRSDGVLWYVGGDSRLLALPRAVTFQEFKKKLEDTSRAEVAAIKYPLLSAGHEDVLVSVACDRDLAHMRNEYDFVEAKRSSSVPSASPPRFRVYVFQPDQPYHSGRAGRNTLPMRRVQSAQELAGRHGQQCYHRHHRCCCCCCCHCHRRCLPACAPVPAQPIGPSDQEPAPRVSTATARGGEVLSETETETEERAVWEFE